MRAWLYRVSQTAFNSLNQLKVTVRSAKGSYTAEEYSHFGSDSRPPEGMTAIYIKSQRDGDECIIGYLHKDRLAAVGEHRIFATDADNVFKFNIWLKSDGTGLIGDSDNPADYTNFAVKFNELKTEFNALKSDHNTLVQKWNSFCQQYAPGSPSTTGTPPSLAASQVTQNTSNIDNAKNEKLKYPT